MKKAPTTTEKFKKQRDETIAIKYFDYTTIADRLRKVSWGTIATQLVWLNRFMDPNFSHTTKAVNWNGHTFKSL